ncbi:hypothetical protein RHECNPAF_28008 [Rhizobium etli CNPAF512]|nr:hypothetical protein RHECNPAF_28008 [Rhizobium etli CNPAF512]
MRRALVLCFMHVVTPEPLHTSGRRALLSRPCAPALPARCLPASRR